MNIERIITRVTPRGSMVEGFSADNIRVGMLNDNILRWEITKTPSATLFIKITLRISVIN